MAYEVGILSEKNLQALAKKGLLKSVKTYKLEFCEHYIIGKKTKVKFAAIHRTEGILDYVHTDIWRPTKMASLRGMHYFVSFIDDFFRYC